MKPLPVRRRLDGLVEELLAPLLRMRDKGLPLRVLGWDVEQGISLYVQYARRVLLIEIEPRDDSQPCFDRTARFNICARVNFGGGDSLTTEEARFVAAVTRMVANREHRLPAAVREVATRNLLVREILVDRVLHREAEGHYYINPYVGCMIGCEFCYVAERADLSWSMEGLPAMPWGRRLDVKVNAPEVLRRELEEAAPGVVRMSPILTDPYQPVERKYRITRGCLQAMQDSASGFVPLLLTRAVRIVEDLDLLRGFPRAAVGFSIPTDQDAFRRMVEPLADPVDARIEALGEFARAGVFPVAVIQPLLPMDPELLVARLAPVARVVRVDRIQFPERSRGLFRRHGIEHVLDPAWSEEIEARLKSGFRDRGVILDEADNLAVLVAASVAA